MQASMLKVLKSFQKYSHGSNVSLNNKQTLKSAQLDIHFLLRHNNLRVAVKCLLKSEHQTPIKFDFLAFKVHTSGKCKTHLRAEVSTSQLKLTAPHTWSEMICALQNQTQYSYVKYCYQYYCTYPTVISGYWSIQLFLNYPYEDTLEKKWNSTHYFHFPVNCSLLYRLNAKPNYTVLKSFNFNCSL